MVGLESSSCWMRRDIAADSSLSSACDITSLLPAQIYEASGLHQGADKLTLVQCMFDIDQPVCPPWGFRGSASNKHL